MLLQRYICQKCDHDFEALVDRGETAECPECASKDLEQQLPRTGMPKVKDAMPSSCGDPSLPPCGAPGCRRMGM
jgi:putative FmdB family regulatory protein